jgi:hypothetical protein
VKVARSVYGLMQFVLTRETLRRIRPRERRKFKSWENSTRRHRMLQPVGEHKYDSYYVSDFFKSVGDALDNSVNGNIEGIKAEVTPLEIARH